MIKFIKNLFKKKETWVFVSYHILLGDKKRQGFGDFTEPINNINKTGCMLNDIKEHIKQDLKKTDMKILA